MDTSCQKKTICYCRVSSRHQKDDLQRQIASMRERYPSAIIIDDVGSGINWKRKGLQSVIKQVIEEDVGTIVIHHRDRLCRFAYELIEFFFGQFGTSILVLDQETSEPGLDQELSDDLLSIINIFSCKKMGRRRYKTNQGSNEIEKEATGAVCLQENSKVSSASDEIST
jgi:predicted site-specific integrase-resolvase